MCTQVILHKPCNSCLHFAVISYADSNKEKLHNCLSNVGLKGKALSAIRTKCKIGRHAIIEAMVT